jgi:RNA polymerase sigma-70 factor (ECF subfamily)
MPEDGSQSLEAIFDRYFGDVYGYVAYRLAPDLEPAGDVTQEVFLAALRSWASYRGDGTVLAWLRAIARRKVADHLRIRRGRDCQADMDVLSQSAAARDVGPQKRALTLAQVMGTLRTEYVELLEEKYLEGLSVRQMAQRHARTEKAIESALSRARQMLKKTFLRLEARQEHPDEHSRL